jgi:23S rRNA (cytosine1962-C5)-methyltransferase
MPPTPAAALPQRSLVVDPAGDIPAVFVRVATWHPLIYRKRIARVEGAKPGDLVAVYGPEDALLGYGLYNPRSEIGLRMLFSGGELPRETRWRQSLETAVSLRKDLLKLEDTTDACRLVHAEADGLSGLVVDRYGDVLSAEVFSLGMYQRAEAIRVSSATSGRTAAAWPSFAAAEACSTCAATRVDSRSRPRSSAAPRR